MSFFHPNHCIFVSLIIVYRAAQHNNLAGVYSLPGCRQWKKKRNDDGSDGNTAQTCAALIFVCCLDALGCRARISQINYSWTRCRENSSLYFFDTVQMWPIPLIFCIHINMSFNSKYKQQRQCFLNLRGSLDVWKCKQESTRGIE